MKFQKNYRIFKISLKNPSMKKPQKIILVGNHLSDVGQNNSIGEILSKHVQRLGWETILVSRKKNRFLRMIDILLTLISRRNDYAIAQIDVFSGLSFVWAYLSARAVKLVNKPVILSLHGGKLADFAERNKKLFIQLVNSANFVTTPSLYLREKLSKFCENIIRIPNGIDLDQYEFKYRKKPAPKLIWLRALHEIYSPTTAVEVLKLLKDKFPEMSLTMVGPDKGDGSLEKVEAMATDYSLGKDVSIIGGVDKKQVPYWLNQADIFINTTRYESFGVSVLEAAACGLPIVTTDAGELPYMWEDGVDALVVPVDDPHAMADAVERILTDPELAGILSANARKKAEGYDWSIIMPQWEALFTELISQNS